MIKEFLLEWLLILAFIFVIFAAGFSVGNGMARNNFYFKCVNMVEMPLGACSRLFGEGK